MRVGGGDRGGLTSLAVGLWAWRASRRQWRWRGDGADDGGASVGAEDASGISRGADR